VDVGTSSGEVAAHRSWSAQDLGLLASVLVGAVLRLWDLGRTPPIVDEVYTLRALDLPLADMVRHLDATDPHPPFAYLVLRVVAFVTDDVGALRAVSALAAIAALVVMAVWQRRAGVAGVVGTLLFALAPYQLGYGREVRMYGVLCLAGVTTAWCAERWTSTDRRGWAVGAVVAATVVAFSHAAGVLLLVALLLVPLRRLDRSAVELRGLTLLGLLGFGVLWGQHALHWSGSSGALPTATPEWAAIVLNELVAPAPDQRWLVLPLVLSGAVLLVLRRDPRARVWVCLFAVPFTVLYLASLDRGVLVPRSLMPFSWGVPLALGALVGWAAERSRVVAGAVVVVVLMAVVPLVGPTLEQGDGSAAAVASVFADARPGDGFAFAASAWQPSSLLTYHGASNGFADLAPLDAGVDGVTVLAPAGTVPSRLWFVGVGGAEAPQELPRCGDPRPLGNSLSVVCLEPGWVSSVPGGGPS
jgi:hypothetical protein